MVSVVPGRRVRRGDPLFPTPWYLCAPVAWAYFGSVAAPRACELPQFWRTRTVLVLASPLVVGILMPTSRLHLRSRALCEASLIRHNDIL
jgi:hypothetical protein